MTTKYRRRALSEIIGAGDLWLRAWLAVIILLATYGMIERLGS